jgi:hypothetical protein
MPWYACADEVEPDHEFDSWGLKRKAKDMHIWQVCHTDGRGGWTTDSNCDGYGLSYEVANYLAECANRCEIEGR